MKSLSSVGLALSVIFVCLFLALVAELYYILWWKKKFIKTEKENKYFYMFSWRKRSSLSNTAVNPQEHSSSLRITSTQINNPNAQHHNSSANSDFLFKPFGENGKETENSSQFPRLLFTIVEETKEDLESEEGKSRVDNNSEKGSRSRSLSDFLITMETPYSTPLASPVFFTPPLTPGNGFNPLYESTTNAEFNGIRSSPPPKFKFLQQAEEKLREKLKEETEKGQQMKDGSLTVSKFLKDDEEEGDRSFITIVVDKEKELSYHHQNLLPQSHSSTSQVLPLVSSPSSTIKSPINKKLILN